jgi:Uma2 family endonuclease
MTLLATKPTPPPPPQAAPTPTLADLLEQLGGVSPARVLVNPPVGTATEQHVLDLHARFGRLFELVDGALVEKAMGFRESALAMLLGQFLGIFVRARNLGLVTGESGMMRLFQGLIRIPDVAFVSWGRVPGGRMPTQPVPHLAPDLAVEVLSEGNTPAEMLRKRREYFEAGVRLVWVVAPDARTVAVYTAPEQPSAVLREHETLTGGDVLPGFTLGLRELFAELDRQAGPPASP